MGEVKSTGSGDSIRRPDRERCFLQLECILKVRQEQRISGVQIDTHHKSYFQIEKVIVHGYKTFSTLKYSEDLICLVRGCFLFRKQPLAKQVISSEYMQFSENGMIIISGRGPFTNDVSEVFGILPPPHQRFTNCL